MRFDDQSRMSFSPVTRTLAAMALVALLAVGVPERGAKRPGRDVGEVPAASLGAGVAAVVDHDLGCPQRDPHRARRRGGHRAGAAAPSTSAIGVMRGFILFPRSWDRIGTESRITRPRRPSPGWVTGGRESRRAGAARWVEDRG